MNKLTSFNEFQPLAIRTESYIDKVRTNKKLLVALLVANVAVTEIMDAIKKQVFYGNSNKLFEKTVENVTHISTALETLKEDLAPDSLEDEIDVNPRVFHALLGMITESGELADALLEAVLGGTIDPVNLQEEATGDMGWYRAILNDALGLDEYQGLTNVINKLRVRYPDKFDSDLAANRNLDAERQQLQIGITFTDANVPDPYKTRV